MKISKITQIIAIFMILLVLSLPFAFATQLNLVYDANGNLVSGDGKYREYNSLNQLYRVRNGSNSLAPLLQEYSYHPIEERVLTKQTYNSTGDVIETVYYWSKSFVTVVNLSGTYNFTYVYHNNELVAQEVNGNKKFFHNDHLGSSTVITDSSGTIIENTTYEPFGTIVEGGTESRYDYEGKEYDEITEDTDFHFRKYKQDWNIFTQPDTLIRNVYEPQSINRYMFEEGNPYKYIDPDGHIGIVFPEFGGGFAAILEGGSSSGGFAVSWTKEKSWQTGFVTSDSYIHDPASGAQGFGFAELSGNAGFSIFGGNVEDLEGQSKKYGLGFSLGHGGQIEYSKGEDDGPWSISFSYSPGIGLDFHYYPVSNTQVSLFTPTPVENNLARGDGHENRPVRGNSGGYYSRGNRKVSYSVYKKGGKIIGGRIGSIGMSAGFAGKFASAFSSSSSSSTS